MKAWLLAEDDGKVNVLKLQMVTLVAELRSAKIALREMIISLREKVRVYGRLELELSAAQMVSARNKGLVRYLTDRLNTGYTPILHL